MGKKKSPRVPTIAGLRALYHELSARRLPYYKTLVRVHLRRGGSFINSVVHLSDEHAELTTKGYRSQVSKVVPLTWTDHRGNTRVRRFEEYTCGALYAPMVTSNAVGRAVDYEWALVLKIDADLAMKRTGEIDDGLVHYLGDIAVAHNDELRLRREKYLNRPCAGRPHKSNTQDLLDRYGDDPNVAAWIKSRRSNLDSDSCNFRHDDYEDQVSRDSVPLENFVGRFDNANDLADAVW
jgi:hypothetical protein